MNFHSWILAFTNAPFPRTKPNQLVNKFVSNGTLSIERFVGLKSGISLMHEVLMQTIRPRSWEKREMRTWCMFPRNWRIQSWKAWLCISVRKERHFKTSVCSFIYSCYAEDTKKSFKESNTVILLKLLIQETYKTYTLICGNCYKRWVRGIAKERGVQE